MAHGDIEGGGGALEDIGEQTGMDGWLLVEEVDLAAIGLLGGQVVGENLGLQTLGDGVVELELDIEAVGGGPGLGQGEALEALARWTVCDHGHCLEYVCCA
jgi:hypothetical protein